jgi:hypothetical protein
MCLTSEAAEDNCEMYLTFDECKISLESGATFTVLFDTAELHALGRCATYIKPRMKVFIFL